MNNHTYINLESSKIEYESLSENEWIKIYFNDKNGGVAQCLCFSSK